MTTQLTKVRPLAAKPVPTPPLPAPAGVPEAGLADSLVFDRDWYLATYPDVAGADPVQHYLSRGAAEHRNPNRSFDTRWYLDRYPDVRRAGINPFLHYVLYGHREGRVPSGLIPRPTRSLRAAPPAAPPAG
ncbi:MAG: hypothetical protein INR65_01890 [Gluconacetobacter diazotrophicus]|nr:hypothetical protein [Gluconacetobacter diazotrophicus]